MDPPTLRALPVTRQILFSSSRDVLFINRFSSFEKKSNSPKYKGTGSISVWKPNDSYDSDEHGD